MAAGNAADFTMSARGRVALATDLEASRRSGLLGAHRDAAGSAFRDGWPWRVVFAELPDGILIRRCVAAPL